MPSTIQTNAKINRKSFQDFSYFLGGIDVTDQNLDKFTPYIQGVSRIWLHKPPQFMDRIYPDLTRNFKTFIEAGYTRVDGIEDISVEFVDFEGGFAGQSFSNVSLARDETNQITIAVYELTGSPLREYLDTWITGTRDTRSGIAHYHGAIKSGEVSYGEINHTAEFVYTTMDPTGMDIEYCCLFAHCFPQGVPKAHLNYETGNRGNVLMEMAFRTSKYESPAINNVGKWYLAASQVEYNYLKFDPHITEDDVNNHAIQYGNSSGNG